MPAYIEYVICRINLLTSSRESPDGSRIYAWWVWLVGEYSTAARLFYLTLINYDDHVRPRAPVQSGPKPIWSDLMELLSFCSVLHSVKFNIVEYSFFLSCNECRFRFKHWFHKECSFIFEQCLNIFFIKKKTVIHISLIELAKDRISPRMLKVHESQRRQSIRPSTTTVAKHPPNQYDVATKYLPEAINNSRW